MAATPTMVTTATAVAQRTPGLCTENPSGHPSRRRQKKAAPQGERVLLVAQQLFPAHAEEAPSFQGLSRSMPAWTRIRTPMVRLSVAADYWALTKPEVNFLIVIATGAGFYLGCPPSLEAFPLMRLMHTLLGTLRIAS